MVSLDTQPFSLAHAALLQIQFSKIVRWRNRRPASSRDYPRPKKQNGARTARLVAPMSHYAPLATKRQGRKRTMQASPQKNKISADQCKWSNRTVKAVSVIAMLRQQRVLDRQVADDSDRRGWIATYTQTNAAKTLH
jgi:hypothetical protein